MPPRFYFGGGGSSGPTLQEQEVETEQALANANLNEEENDQRKSILNAMMGTRVFKGSALSRALRGNTPGSGGVTAAGAPSKAQSQAPIVTPAAKTLLTTRQAGASGQTPSGGVGASGSVAIPSAPQPNPALGIVGVRA